MCLPKDALPNICWPGPKENEAVEAIAIEKRESYVVVATCMLRECSSIICVCIARMCVRQSMASLSRSLSLLLGLLERIPIYYFAWFGFRH